MLLQASHSTFGSVPSAVLRLLACSLLHSTALSQILQTIAEGRPALPTAAAAAAVPSVVSEYAFSAAASDTASAAASKLSAAAAAFSTTPPPVAEWCTRSDLERLEQLLPAKFKQMNPDEGEEVSHSIPL